MAKTNQGKFFGVADFWKLQHYGRYRHPPWVKLYYALLDDPNFISLSIESRHHYFCLLLVASRLDNQIPLDLQYLRRVMRIDQEPDLTPLFSAGFLLATCKRNNGRLLADCSKNDVPEKSRKEEKREEKKRGEEEGGLGGEPKEENCKEPLEGIFTQSESVKTLPNEIISLKHTRMNTEEEKNDWNKILSDGEAKSFLRSMKGGGLS